MAVAIPDETARESSVIDPYPFTSRASSSVIKEPACPVRDGAPAIADVPHTVLNAIYILPNVCIYAHPTTVSAASGKPSPACHSRPLNSLTAPICDGMTRTIEL